MAALWDDPVARWDDIRFSWDGEAISLSSIVFPLPTPSLSSVLRGPHMPVIRLDIFDSDDSIAFSASEQADYADRALLSFDVSTDRRSDTFSQASVQVVDQDGRLRPDVPTSLVWPGRKARLSRGALVAGVPVLVDLITGTIANPQDSPWSGSVQFSIDSPFAIAKRNFTGPTTFESGQRGRDAIRRGLELGGYGTSDLLYDLDDGGFVVDVPRTFDTKDEILGSMVKWAFDMGCDLWPNGSGVAVMRPFVDPSTVAPTWDFDAGQQAHLIDLGRQISGRQLYNRVIVEGRGVDGYTFRAEAKVTNPADPLYWTPDRDFPKFYPSPDVTNFETALSIARQLLAEASAYEENLTGEAVPVPLVAARDVVSFSGAGYAQGFLLDTANIPSRGTMRMATRRVRSVTA